MTRRAGTHQPGDSRVCCRAVRPETRAAVGDGPLIASRHAGRRIFDTAANGLFSLATTQGYLSIVGVIGSLYPVTTVVLAYVVLRERLERRQLCGVLAALAGVAVIAAR